ncbi:unnamed protein product [Trichobilharzia regenti]|nr:unnamed protein product [Trichobilharzia regenti]
MNYTSNGKRDALMLSRLQGLVTSSQNNSDIYFTFTWSPVSSAIEVSGLQPFMSISS